MKIGQDGDGAVARGFQGGLANFCGARFYLEAADHGRHDAAEAADEIAGVDGEIAGDGEESDHADGQEAADDHRVGVIDQVGGGLDEQGEDAEGENQGDVIAVHVSDGKAHLGIEFARERIAENEFADGGGELNEGECDEAFAGAQGEMMATARSPVLERAMVLCSSKRCRPTRMPPKMPLRSEMATFAPAMRTTI